MIKEYKLTIPPDIDFHKIYSSTKYFENKEDMDNYSDRAADVLLFIQNKDVDIMPDRSNMFIKEILINGIYEEIE